MLRPRALEHNLARYKLYTLCREAYPWMPIFFLYFGEHLSLGQVLSLEAVYYLGVVALEVPSGYLSDRLGRRPTLILSALCLLLSYALFFFDRGFNSWAAAQLLLAAGLSFASGTDTSLHYDTLEQLGQQDQYEAQSAQLGRLGAWSMAAGALIGGALACFELSWAYGLSAGLALICLWCCIGFVEPAQEDATRDTSVKAQLVAVARATKPAPMRWLFGVALLGVILNHVPYEFYSGYIGLALGQRDIPPGLYAPLIAGAHTTGAAILAGAIAGHSDKLRRRLGLRAALLLGLLLQLGLIAAMGLWLHAAMIGVLLIRGVPGALMRAPLQAALMPKLPRQLRATYLSAQSLAGRLGFAALLLLLAHDTPAATAVTWPTLSTKLNLATLCGLGLLIPLILWRPKLDA